MPLTLEQALTIARVTVETGRQRGLSPLCAVVLDPGGHALALLRDERASIMRPKIATSKAAGCLGMGFGGRELARRAAALPQLFATLNSVFPDGILPLPGGVLLRDADGVLLGAVGVSGETPDNDEICALAGIAAAGLIAETGA